MEAVRVPTLNETVCDTLDYAYSLGQNRTGEASATVSASEYVIYGSSLFVSLTLLFFGARIMKPVAILSAAVGGFSFAYLVLENGFGADCTARIVSGVILASLGAGVTGCLFKVALFIIGAAAFGSIVHIIFLAAPSLHAVGNLPQMMDRSLAYYLALTATGLTGGILARVYEKRILRFMTSLFGGVGVSLSIYNMILIDSDSSPPDPWIFVALAGVLFLTGWLAQERVMREKSRQIERQKTKRGEARDDERGDRR